MFENEYMVSIKKNSLNYKKKLENIRNLSYLPC
jgi:hypothetical protein